MSISHSLVEPVVGGGLSRETTHKKAKSDGVYITPEGAYVRVSGGQMIPIDWKRRPEPAEPTIHNEEGSAYEIEPVGEEESDTPQDEDSTDSNDSPPVPDGDPKPKRNQKPKE